MVLKNRDWIVLMQLMNHILQQQASMMVLDTL